MFEVLIIGGGVSGMSCASIGLCKNKKFATENNQNFHSSKNHHLSELFLITPDSCCRNIGLGFIVKSTQLSQLYPHVTQIPDEKS
jgi:hypothetical protein